MKTDTPDETTPFDACVAKIDRREQQWQRRIITLTELSMYIADALDAYFAEQDPRDDVELLLAYARAVIERFTDDPLYGDRQGLDSFDRRIRRNLHEPVAMARLADLLEPIRAGTPPDLLSDTLESLCRSGHRLHQTVFMFDEAVEQTLQLAWELRDIDALAAAVNPDTPSYDQPLGHAGRYNRHRDRAFDYLAELANRPDAVGDRAVDELVRLCTRHETCTEAVVRLPAHRLTPDQRAKLLDAAESMDELIADDVFQYPPGHLIRMPDAVRSVLWLANDADHL